MVRTTSKRSNTRVRRMGVYTDQAYIDDRVLYRKYGGKLDTILAKMRKIDDEKESTKATILGLDKEIERIKEDIKHGWGVALDSPHAAKELLNHFKKEREALGYKYMQLSSEYIALQQLHKKNFDKLNKYGIDSTIKRSRAYNRIPPTRRPRSRY